MNALICTPLRLPAPDRRIDDYDLGYSDGLWDRPMRPGATERYQDGYYDALVDCRLCPDIDEDEIPF